MQPPIQDQFAKVLAEFQNEDGTQNVEGLHAVPRGNGLYELRNIPLFASGYHLYDIVRCQEFDDKDVCPTIIELVTPSGHQTLGIIFADKTTGEEQADVLVDIHERFHNLVYARVTKTHCAFSFPSSDREEISRILADYVEHELISSYEELL